MKRIFIILMMLHLGGCTTHMTDLSMISNKNISLDKVDIDKLPQEKHIEGEDSKFIFLFPLGPVSYTHLDVYKRQLPLCAE